MKILKKGLLVISLLGLFSGCGDDDETELLGNWVESSDFNGVQRSNAVSFVIGNTAYVGTGYNGEEDEYLVDMYAYNVERQFWTEIAPFPGIARTSAVAFAIDGKGYVGTGYDGDDELSDFYEYDPETDTWNTVAPFGGSARRNAVGFAINGKGYVGTGYDGSTTKDFWEYDPETDSWEEIPSIGGGKREGATVFVIDGLAYVGTGEDNGIYEDDFWKFDPSLLPDFPWIRMTDIDDNDDYVIERSNAVGFSVDGLGYIATGAFPGTTGSVWEFDPIQDIWTERTALEGTTRADAVAFVLQNQAFVTTGRSGGLYFDDMWMFQPTAALNEDD